MGSGQNCSLERNDDSEVAEEMENRLKCTAGPLIVDQRVTHPGRHFQNVDPRFGYFLAREHALLIKYIRSPATTLLLSRKPRNLKLLAESPFDFEEATSFPSVVLTSSP